MWKKKELIGVTSISAIYCRNLSYKQRLHWPTALGYLLQLCKYGLIRISIVQPTQASPRNKTSSLFDFMPKTLNKHKPIHLS